MKKLLILLLTISLFANCLTLKKNKNENVEKDYETMLLSAQELTNKGKYQKSIDMLEEIRVKFAEENSIELEYNTGFNYYKLKRYDDARVFLTRTIKRFETEKYSQEQVAELQKFVTLARIVLQKIEKNIEDAKDPYHIKEEIANSNRVKAKKR